MTENILKHFQPKPSGGENAFSGQPLAMKIGKLRYRNLAMEGAREAYLSNSSDMDGYQRQLRSSLKNFPIPLAERSESRAILSDKSLQSFLAYVKYSHEFYISSGHDLYARSQIQRWGFSFLSWACFTSCHRKGSAKV